MRRFSALATSLLGLVVLLIGVARTNSAQGLLHDSSKANSFEDQEEYVGPSLAELVAPTTAYTYYLPVVCHNWEAPTWRSLGLRGVWIRSLAVDPNGVLYAGTNDHGVYKSMDTGDHWYPVNYGLWDDAAILQVEVDPYVSQTVYVSTNEANPFFFYSQDGGESWQPRGFFSHPPLELKANPAAQGYLLAGDAVLDWAGGRLYRSDDSGMNWTMVITEQVIVTSIAMSDMSPSPMYAGTGAGLYRSNDSGDTWSQLTNGLPDGPVQAVALNPAAPTIAYVSAGAETYRTTDGGESWSPWGILLPPYGVYDLLISTNHSEQQYATSGPSGVYVSSDEGMHWQAMNTGLGNLGVHALVLNQAASHLFAATSDGVWSLSLVGEDEP